jgi:dienelactone hydrolase
MNPHRVRFAVRFSFSMAVCFLLSQVDLVVRAQLPTGNTPASSIATHGYVLETKPIKGSDIPLVYTFVLTRDQIYVPIIIRKPKGDGPFPAVTMGWGEGREGMQKVEDLARSFSELQNHMLARGYVVVTVNYRNEIPYAYEQSKPPQNLPDSISGERRMLKSGPTLDHEDLIAILQYVKSLPYVKKDGVGAIGVSHSGEMIMKAAAEYTFNAGICVEPANHEFLTVNTGPTAPRKDNEIQYNDIEVARKNANKAEAMERIQRIQTPILIFGRDTDHQQGIFKLTYEWMKEDNKDVTWYSFNHPVHGYVLIRNQPDGSYKPDEIQQKTYEIFMAYFDTHLKK